MIKKICIVGYGSIGQKHHKIFKEHFKDIEINVISNHLKKKKFIFNNIEDIKIINPDYIIISTITKNHYSDLKYIDSNLSKKIILVEKPLFMNNQKYKSKKNLIFVGYNLRFHPVIKLIKDLIKNKKIIETNIYAGSFLPSWRNNNYINSYSADKKLGGGVKLDLSHELDYCLFLLGEYKINFYINKKISNLKIKSEDYLSLFGKSIKQCFINMTLNYFTKIPYRRIIMNGNNISLEADLINNKIKYILNNKLYNKKFPKNSLMKSYLYMHESILNKNYKNISKLDEGIKIMKLIEQIK